MKCILCVIVISIQIRQSNELTRIDEFRKLQFVESKTNNLQIESNDIECQLTESRGIPFISPTISRDLVCNTYCMLLLNDSDIRISFTYIGSFRWVLARSK